MARSIASAISRYPVPALAELPADIRERMLEVQEKAGFIPNVFLTLAHRPDEFRAFFAYHDALMLRESGLDQGGAGNDRRRDFGRQRLPVLHRRPRRDPARLRQESRSSPIRSPSTIRKADISDRQKAMLEFALKVALRSVELVDADYAAVKAHGFTDEDIWDIGAIAAFFALSNRMANLIAMRPNDEFYLLGRVAKGK